MAPMQQKKELISIVKCEKILSCDMGECVLKDKKPFKDGGQGALFHVTIDGNRYVMKLHIPKYCDRFLEGHIKSVIAKRPTPAINFAWPLSFVEAEVDYLENGIYKSGKSIGYIMELVSNEYKDINDAIEATEFYQNDRLKLCINICRAYRQLHECQYSYKDINRQNVMFHPKTLQVKIIDNDNITINGEQITTRGIVEGTREYKAPEIVDRRMRCANIKADLHSLAVLLFQILFIEHPLHGKRFLYNDFSEKELYSSEHACFIFKDKNNLDKYIEISQSAHQTAKETWEAYPKSIKDMFYKVFVDCLDNPNARPSADDWTEALVKALSRYYDYNCPKCGISEGYRFYDDEKKGDLSCEGCGAQLLNPYMASIHKNRRAIDNITALYDKKVVYSCYIDPNPYNIDKDLFTPIFIAHVDKKGQLCLESCQNNTLKCDEQIIQKGEKSPYITSETKIQIGDYRCRIKGKNL